MTDDLLLFLCWCSTVSVVFLSAVLLDNWFQRRRYRRLFLARLSE